MSMISSVVDEQQPIVAIVVDGLGRHAIGLEGVTEIIPYWDNAVQWVAIYKGVKLAIRVQVNMIVEVIYAN
jgi:hypothetical protein